MRVAYPLEGFIEPDGLFLYRKNRQRICTTLVEMAKGNAQIVENEEEEIIFKGSNTRL